MAGSITLCDILKNQVIRDHLFSYLEVDDLLRLRKASKTTKEEAEDFIRTKNVTTNRTLHFNLSATHTTSECIHRYTDKLKQLPLRKRAYITLPDKEELSPVQASKFELLRLYLLETSYATSIVHLVLSGLPIPLNSCESKFAKFFDSFPNLTHLTIESAFSPNEIPSTTASPSSRIPTSFKKLKSLIVWNIANNDYSDEAQEAFNFIAKVVETCLPTLEELQLPYNQLVEFTYVNMKQVLKLFGKCMFAAPNLKLINVDGSCIEDMLKPFRRMRELRTMNAMTSNINDKIISIMDPMYRTFHLELPNLEQIIFDDIEKCRMPDSRNYTRREWPNLSLIFIGTMKDYPNIALPPPKPAQVWNFLFGNGIQRKKVVTLQVGFDGFKNIIAGKEQQGTMSRTMDLISSCPNLKILHIHNEIKQLVELHILWKGLPLLEDILFDNCKDLADYDFIGDDPKNPVFFNLKKLKKLKIDGIKKGITNHFLNKVICHMPLKDFILSCNSQTPGQHSICIKGILFLLYGKFGKTIENINLSKLHIHNVPIAKKARILARFRAV